MDVLIAAGGGSWEPAALEFVETHAQLTLFRRCVDTVDLLAAAPDVSDGTALVDPDLDGLDTDIVWQLVSAGIRVFLVCSGTADSARIDAKSTALGATGVVTDDEFSRMLAAIMSAPERMTTDSAMGRTIAVWGPAGAPGRTTVAVGIADQFAASAHENVVLVDADPYGGAVAPMLGVMDEVSGLVAAIRAASNGRHSATEQSAYRVGAFDVLTGLPHAGMWKHARPAGFDKVLREAKQYWSTTVIDTGFSLEDASGPDSLRPQRNQLTRLALEYADHVVVCGNADPIGLSRLVRGLHELREEIPTCRPIVAVNRFRPGLGWRRSEIAETVQRLAGIRPDVFIPHDLRTLDNAMIEGRTVREAAPDCDLISSFAAVTGLCGLERAGAPDRAS